MNAQPKELLAPQSNSMLNIFFHLEVHFEEVVRVIDFTLVGCPKSISHALRQVQNYNLQLNFQGGFVQDVHVGQACYTFNTHRVYKNQTGCAHTTL